MIVTLTVEERRTRFLDTLETYDDGAVLHLLRLESDQEVFYLLKLAQAQKRKFRLLQLLQQEWNAAAVSPHKE